MPTLINWELLSNPLNWIVVALMLAIAAFGLHMVLGAADDYQHTTGSAGV